MRLAFGILGPRAQDMIWDRTQLEELGTRSVWGSRTGRVRLSNKGQDSGKDSG